MGDHLEGLAVNLETWWTDLPPLDRIPAAVDAGFHLAEIWFWRHWDIDRLVGICRDTGLALTQIGGWDFEPRMNDPAHATAFHDGIAAACEVAVRLGVDRVNINGPYLLDGEDPSAVQDEIAHALGSVVHLAEEAGIELMIEPMNPQIDHPGYSLPASLDVIEICRSVESHALGINWDVYHLYVAEGAATRHLLDAAPHLAYVQVADHPGRHEPGTGRIDFARVFDALEDAEYTGPIGLECYPLDTPRMAIDRIRQAIRTG